MIYLCGGINGLSDAECKGWREVATEQLGAERVLDPMRRDYRGVEDANFEQIVEGDLKDIEECEGLLVNVERPSWGTAMEIVYAGMARKWIVGFGAGERVSPWLRYHVELVRTLGEAIEICKGRIGE